ncbi:MAG TPA: hypothetical protein VGF43_19675 [Dongiaceae bacterium]
MDQRIFERRRLLQFFAFGSVTLPAAILAGCETSSAGSRPPRYLQGGGSSSGKSGNNGGAGNGGGHASK